SDTLEHFIPDYPQAVTRPATIAQLASFRAGVADFFGPAFRDAPKDQFASNADYYRFAAAQPAVFAPGEREMYCNGCYAVLGEIIARVTGGSYEDYIAAHVLQPAGMTHSGFFHADALPPNTVRLYGRPRPDSDLVDVANFQGRAGSAAGGIY